MGIPGAAGIKDPCQMPCKEEPKSDASDLWQPFSVEDEGCLQLLPKANGKHCWAGCSPALAYILHGCSVEGKPFPHQPVPPSLWICHCSPTNSASLSPLTPHLFPAFLPNLALSPQAIPLVVLSYLQATGKAPSPCKS